MRIHSTSDPYVEVIQAHVCHLNCNMVGSDDGVRDVDDLENFRASVLIDSNCLHTSDI